MEKSLIRWRKSLEWVGCRHFSGACNVWKVGRRFKNQRSARFLKIEMIGSRFGSNRLPQYWSENVCIIEFWWQDNEVQEHFLETDYWSRITKNGKKPWELANHMVNAMFSDHSIYYFLLFPVGLMTSQLQLVDAVALILFRFSIEKVKIRFEMIKNWWRW